MQREAKKTVLTLAQPTHVDLFVEYYDELRRWAVKFTEGDQERAEDLLHDLFIHFTLARPDLSQIQNLEGYLYVVMRNLHLSQVRRATRAPIRSLSAVEYDTADVSLWWSDPRDRLKMRDELVAVCQYACFRRQSSKAGSVLILRFFHGYYPEEIALVLRSSRSAVDNRLLLARTEAKTYLTDPSKLEFIGGGLTTEPSPTQIGDDLIAGLRRQIFRSKQGECFSADALRKLYRSEKCDGPDQRTLAHIVSCEKCLDEVNDMLEIPRLAARYPLDTVGKDPGNKHGGGSGGGTGGGSGGGKMLDNYLLRREAVYHHRPEELCISVNGQMQSFQKISAAKNELTLVIDMFENLGFVEVFSEQGMRLLMLNVEPPPAGEAKQSTSIELSDGRMVGANLSFGGAFPTLHVAYNDPMLNSDAIGEMTEAPNLEAPPLTKEGWPSLRGRGGSLLDGFKYWLQPARLTTGFAMLVIAALIWFKLGPTTTVSAAELLQKSADAETAKLANKDRVLHRTLDLEEYKDGQLASRKRIDVWQSTEKGITARRLYDEQGRLTMGDWRAANGIQTIYKRGESAKLQPLPENRTTIINPDDAWQLSLNAQEFVAYLGSAEKATVEQRPNDYLISYARPGSPPARGGVAPASGDEVVGDGIVKASIVLSRDDLHATEQTFTLRSAEGTRDYRMVETSYEWKPFSVVAPSVFEPNVELTKSEPGAVATGFPDTVTTEAGVAAATNTNTSTAPSAMLATAALEVEIVEALNNAGAFMGEQISVSRTADGKLSVSALVETDQRKSALLAALAPHRSNQAVRIKIETVAEAQAAAKKQKQSGGQTVTPGSVQQVEVKDNVSPVQAELDKRFTEIESKAYANRALGRMRQAWQHAVAMKQISQRFSAADLQSLSPAERSRWVSLIRGHADKFLNETESLRGQLAQVFPEAAARVTSGGAIGSDTELQARVRDLYEASVTLDRGMDRSFSLGSGSAPIKTDTFWRTFSQAMGLARSISAAR